MNGESEPISALGSVPTEAIAGFRVHAMDPALFAASFIELLNSSDGGFVTLTGAHGVVEAARSESLASAHRQAAIVVPDGYPLARIARRASPSAVQMPGRDVFALASSIASALGKQQLLLGGPPGLAERTADGLKRYNPALKFLEPISPPFAPLVEWDFDALAQQVSESGADVVWVGLSTPKQEEVMVQLLRRLPGCVFLGVGAAFDMWAGTVRIAPRAVQRVHMEWAFRALTEPRRLLRRYMKVVPAFAKIAVAERRRRA